MSTKVHQNVFISGGFLCMGLLILNFGIFVTIFIVLLFTVCAYVVDFYRKSQNRRIRLSSHAARTMKRRSEKEQLFASSSQWEKSGNTSLNDENKHMSVQSAGGPLLSPFSSSFSSLPRVRRSQISSPLSSSNINRSYDISNQSLRVSSSFVDTQKTYPTHLQKYHSLGMMPSVRLSRNVLNERNAKSLRSPVTVKIAPPESFKVTSPVFTRTRVQASEDVDPCDTQAVLSALREKRKRTSHDEEGIPLVLSDAKRRRAGPTDDEPVIIASGTPNGVPGMHFTPVNSLKRPAEVDSMNPTPELTSPPSRKVVKQTPSRNNHILSSYSSSKRFLEKTASENQGKRQRQSSRASTPVGVSKKLNTGGDSKRSSRKSSPAVSVQGDEQGKSENNSQLSTSLVEQSSRSSTPANVTQKQRLQQPLKEGRRRTPIFGGTSHFRHVPRAAFAPSVEDFKKDREADLERVKRMLSGLEEEKTATPVSKTEITPTSLATATAPSSSKPAQSLALSGVSTFTVATGNQGTSASTTASSISTGQVQTEASTTTQASSASSSQGLLGLLKSPLTSATSSAVPNLNVGGNINITTSTPQVAVSTNASSAGSATTFKPLFPPAASAATLESSSTLTSSTVSKVSEASAGAISFGLVPSTQTAGSFSSNNNASSTTTTTANQFNSGSQGNTNVGGITTTTAPVGVPSTSTAFGTPFSAPVSSFTLGGVQATSSNSFGFQALSSAPPPYTSVPQKASMFGPASTAVVSSSGTPQTTQASMSSGAQSGQTTTTSAGFTFGVTAVSPATTTQTTALSVQPTTAFTFGSTTPKSTFGAAQSTQASGLGVSATQATQANAFGAGTGQTTQPSMFGASSTQAVQPNMFGTSVSTTQNSQLPLFGTPSALSSQSNVFGSPAAQPLSSMFGAPVKTVNSGQFGSTTTPATQSSIFGPPSSQATQTPVFGAPTTQTAQSSGFGFATTPSTSQGSLFTTSEVIKSTLFGGTPNQTTQSSVFGVATSQSTQPSLFNFGVNTQSAQSSTFGSSATTTSQNMGPNFGSGQSSISANQFGGSAPSAAFTFGQSSTANSSASPFGTTNSSGSPFGTTNSSGSPFGTTNSSASPFGTTNSSASPFGTTSSASPFGTAIASSQPSMFGSTAAQKTTASPGFNFGSAAQNPGTGGFNFAAASNNQSSTSGFNFGGSSTAFGGSGTPAFGSTNSSPAFGNGGGSGTPTFGSPKSSPAFGGSETSAFGTSNSSPAFGSGVGSGGPAFLSPNSSPAFGSSTSVPAFGSGSAPSLAFGATSSPGFGATSGTTGAPTFSIGSGQKTVANRAIARSRRRGMKK